MQDNSAIMAAATESASARFSLNTSSLQLQRSDFTYTSSYCEENVYLLCKTLCSAGVAVPQGSDLFVVFISNENRKVPLWHQKASKEAEGFVKWDYHVICVQKSTEKDAPVQVLDLDTMLPFPVPLDRYITEAIRPSLPLYPEFRSGRGPHVEALSDEYIKHNSAIERLFRVIHCPIFLRCFASDRRHMRNSEGNWIAPPPPYNCITAEDGSVHNLETFVSMNKENVNSKVEGALTGIFELQTGVVIDESMLEELFIQI